MNSPTKQDPSLESQGEQAEKKTAPACGPFAIKAPVHIKKMLLEAAEGAPWSFEIDFWGADKIVLGGTPSVQANTRLVVHHPGVLRELCLTADQE